MSNSIKCTQKFRSVVPTLPVTPPYLVQLLFYVTVVQAQTVVIVLHHTTDNFSHVLVVLGAHMAEVDVVWYQVMAYLVT